MHSARGGEARAHGLLCPPLTGAFSSHNIDSLERMAILEDERRSIARDSVGLQRRSGGDVIALEPYVAPRATSHHRLAWT